MAVKTLFALLDEFLELRSRHAGLHAIFADYVSWRVAQGWSS